MTRLERIKAGLMCYSEIERKLGICRNTLYNHIYEYGYLPEPAQLVGKRLFFTPDQVQLIEKYFTDRKKGSWYRGE